MGRMGLQFGLENTSTIFKRKFRWLLRINGVSAESGPTGINSLPPLKSARPNISFKEIEIQHLTETVYFAGKPDWKPITLTLFDLKRNYNPVFGWLKKIYDPQIAKWSYLDTNPKDQQAGAGIKRNCYLELYDGCGCLIETWVYENAWPQTIEFGELDMTNSDVVTVDLTLRYDRAYIKESTSGNGSGNNLEQGDFPTGRYGDIT